MESVNATEKPKQRTYLNCASPLTELDNNDYADDDVDADDNAIPDEMHMRDNATNEHDQAGGTLRCTSCDRVDVLPHPSKASLRMTLKNALDWKDAIIADLHSRMDECDRVQAELEACLDSLDKSIQECERFIAERSLSHSSNRGHNVFTLPETKQLIIHMRYVDFGCLQRNDLLEYYHNLVIFISTLSNLASELDVWCKRVGNECADEYINNGRNLTDEDKNMANDGCSNGDRETSNRKMAWLGSQALIQYIHRKSHPVYVLDHLKYIRAHIESDGSGWTDCIGSIGGNNPETNLHSYLKAVPFPWINALGLQVSEVAVYAVTPIQSSQLSPSVSATTVNNVPLSPLAATTAEGGENVKIVKSSLFLVEYGTPTHVLVSILNADEYRDYMTRIITPPPSDQQEKHLPSSANSTTGLIDGESMLVWGVKIPREVQIVMVDELMATHLIEAMTMLTESMSTSCPFGRPEVSSSSPYPPTNNSNGQIAESGSLNQSATRPMEASSLGQPACAIGGTGLVSYPGSTFIIIENAHGAGLTTRSSRSNNTTFNKPETNTKSLERTPSKKRLDTLLPIIIEHDRGFRAYPYTRDPVVLNFYMLSCPPAHHTCRDLADLALMFSQRETGMGGNRNNNNGDQPLNTDTSSRTLTSSKPDDGDADANASKEAQFPIRSWTPPCGKTSLSPTKPLKIIPPPVMFTDNVTLAESSAPLVQLATSPTIGRPPNRLVVDLCDDSGSDNSDSDNENGNGGGGGDDDDDGDVDIAKRPNAKGTSFSTGGIPDCRSHSMQPLSRDATYVGGGGSGSCCNDYSGASGRLSFRHKIQGTSPVGLDYSRVYPTALSQILKHVDEQGLIHDIYSEISEGSLDRRPFYIPGVHLPDQAVSFIGCSNKVRFTVSQDILNVVTEYPPHLSQFLSPSPQFDLLRPANGINYGASLCIIPANSSSDDPPKPRSSSAQSTRMDADDSKSSPYIINNAESGEIALIFEDYRQTPFGTSQAEEIFAVAAAPATTTGTTKCEKTLDANRFGSLGFTYVKWGSKKHRAIIIEDIVPTTVVCDPRDSRFGSSQVWVSFIDRVVQRVSQNWDDPAIRHNSNKKTGQEGSPNLNGDDDIIDDADDAHFMNDTTTGANDVLHGRPTATGRRHVKAFFGGSDVTKPCDRYAFVDIDHSSVTSCHMFSLMLKYIMKHAVILHQLDASTTSLTGTPYASAPTCVTNEHLVKTLFSLGYPIEAASQLYSEFPLLQSLCEAQILEDDHTKCGCSQSRQPSTTSMIASVDTSFHAPSYRCIYLSRFPLTELYELLHSMDARLKSALKSKHTVAWLFKYIQPCSFATIHESIALFKSMANQIH